MQSCGNDRTILATPPPAPSSLPTLQLPQSASPRRRRPKSKRVQRKVSRLLLLLPPHPRTTTRARLHKVSLLRLLLLPPPRQSRPRPPSKAALPKRPAAVRTKARPVPALPKSRKALQVRHHPRVPPQPVMRNLLNRVLLPKPPARQPKTPRKIAAPRHPQQTPPSLNPLAPP